jgi:ATP/ADP translocase
MDLARCNGKHDAQMEPLRKKRLTALARFPLAGLTDVPPEDRPTALLLFIHVFGSAGGYVTARTVADSLFLSQIGTAKLPAMYMVAAGAVALVSILYGWHARRQSLRRIIRWTLGTWAVISVALPTLMYRHPGSLALFAGVYVFAQIRGAIGSVQFTTLLNEQFTRGRQANVFGLVGMGATASGIVLGGLVGWLGQRMSTEDLMYVAAAMDLVAFLPIMFLRSGPVGTAATPEINVEYGMQTPELVAPANGSVGPPAKLIAGLVCLTVVVSTLVEFQWKVAAAEELARDEARLTTYFGYFYAVVFLLTGASQLILTGRFIHRLGILPALMVLPLTLAAASVCTLAASAHRILLWAITFAKGCDVLRRSLNDPAVQMLYAPMPKQVRRQAIAVVHGIAKPSSEAVAAVGILLAVPVIAVRQLSYIALFLAVAWLGLVAWYWIVSARGRAKN